MQLRTTITSVVLGGLIAVGGWLVHARGDGFSLGAPPAALAAPFTTEEAWIVDEIFRDITEMSAFPGSPPEVRIRAVAGQPGKYTVAIAGAATTDVDLQNDLWGPQAFAVVATAAGRTSSTPASDGALAPAHIALLDLTAPTLVDESARISRVLQSNMDDARAHEAAALVVAGFGLRESANRSSDTRWAMNRITAHLAMAAALRHDEPTVDGRLAEAVLLTLAGHQKRALYIVDVLDTPRATAAGRAWARALRMRITEDWRALPSPADASRLELREYIRARRATIRNMQTRLELADLHQTPDADWIRIFSNSTLAVADGHLLEIAFDAERAEYAEVFRRMHQRDIGDVDIDALNAPATRTVAARHVEVLPWGAWAEFAQRHIAMAIGRTDSYWRFSIGAPARADALKQTLHDRWHGLWTFPAATAWWTKGPNGKEADLSYINEAVDAILARPDRVTAKTWSFLEMGTHYERVRRGLPPANSWYMKPAPRTAYEAVPRIQDSGHGGSPDEIAALLAESPDNYLLAAEMLKRKYGVHTPFNEVLRLAGERTHYDTRPLESALNFLPFDDERRLPLLNDGCAFSSSLCITWGAELASRHRDGEAAAAYERAFADRTLDPVVVANSTRWLVNYYAATRQMARAFALAERAAATKSFDGQVTLAHLYERVDRRRDAEDEFADAAQHYDNRSELAGFYYRRAVIDSDPRYADAWQQVQARLFPLGLEHSAIATDKPAKGVYVESDTDASRTIGLRAGDIIVGVDGWHVNGVLQYRAVRAFPESGSITLTIWRGPGLVTVVIPDRAFVPYFSIDNYPVEGWIER